WPLTNAASLSPTGCSGDEGQTTHDAHDSSFVFKMRLQSVALMERKPAFRAAPKVRHVILCVLCLMYFVAYVDRVNISVAAPRIKKDLALTPIELGLMFSAFAYPYAAMQIAGGWAADRFGPRLVLAVLSLVWAAGTILTGVSRSVASFVAFRLLVGIGEG